MIKGFRARLRLFSNEPKTEKSNRFCESESVSEKNGFLIKVAESGIPPGAFRNQQDILLKTILAGKRRVEEEKKELKTSEEGVRKFKTSEEEKRKLKTSNDFQTKADIEPEVVNHDNVFGNVEFNTDVQNDIQNDVHNEVKIDIDVVEIERENLSNDAAKVTSIHPDVDRQIQDRPIQDQENPNPGQTGSVDGLPESESHQLSENTNNNKNIEVIPKTESELNLNETADQITSIETSRPPSGHHPGQPRRCQSQRENRIVNPRLRKFSVPTTLLEHGIQGNR
jgi:hypothetical protein